MFSVRSKDIGSLMQVLSLCTTTFSERDEESKDEDEDDEGERWRKLRDRKWLGLLREE